MFYQKGWTNERCLKLSKASSHVQRFNENIDKYFALMFSS